MTHNGTRAGAGVDGPCERSSLRVCFVCHEYPPASHGGIGTFTHAMSEALASAGYRARVIGVYSAEARGMEEDRGGVRVARLPASRCRFGWLWERARLYRDVRRWSRRGEIDIVEVPDWEGWAAGWPRLPVPVVTRLHGSVTYFAAEAGEKTRRVAYWLEKTALRRADYLVAVSRYVAERTRQRFRMQRPVDAVLHNAVDVSAPVSAPVRAANQVVFTGTLTPKKGVESLFRAWSIVCEGHPTAELHLYGKDGRAANGQSMRGRLASLLRESDRPRIHFHGHQPRDVVLRALRTARAAVFPSYAEAFAMAPLEAMATGCPTIHTQRCSGPELLEHGVHGLLVDPDRPADIAAHLLRLLGDDVWAARLGEAGRAHAQRWFGLERQLAANIGFYQQCIADFHGRGSR